MIRPKKICVVTGTRAEYGLLRLLMDLIEQETNFELQIIATGMHLSPEFGLTYTEIEKDGFSIDRKIEMLISADTSSAISKSVGLGMISFADAYNELKPDIVIVLGDRFEILSASTAALFATIPLAHIHGGETTAGAFDEAIRHSITKMAWWHFVAANEYRSRVIQMGENPERVFNVGGLGVDGIRKTRLLKRSELEKSIQFHFGKKNLLVTFHPVTLENNSSESQFKTLLSVLKNLEDTHIIFTKANSDKEGRIINKLIDQYVAINSTQSIAFTSMGQLNYLSAMQYVDAVVGNSSSGLAEAPTFRIGTINIGDRQKGRLKAASVIDCEPQERSIEEALKSLYSSNFKKILETVKNPYGDGHAAEKILKVLKTSPVPDELKKDFYDFMLHHDPSK